MAELETPETDKETVGIFEWMITIPFMLIPGINVVLAAILVGIDRTSKTKRNFYYAVIWIQIIWFFIENIFLK